MRLVLRLLSLALILGAAGLLYRESEAYRQAARFFPSGSIIAGVPVGGLDRGAAIERVQRAYSLPVELQYGGAAIQLSPQAAGFALDLERMLPAEAEMDPAGGFLLSLRSRLSDPAFQNYLQGQASSGVEIPLQYSLSRERLRAALQGIAARYDTPPTAARPYPASVDFLPGSPGSALDVEAALPLVEKALPSLTSRVVNLPTHPVAASRPDFADLQPLLKQNIADAGFDSLADVFLVDLRSGQKIHFAVRGGLDLPVQPDIAFSASSTIKIPILVSLFRRLPEEPSETANGWLQAMFFKSSNEAADAAMKNVIDEVRGPLAVTEDLRALGLENTFLAGYFAQGSPLLQLFQTPANQRVDVKSTLDIYNQTTPSDIGTLLQYIYRCAKTGDGKLVETFPGEITQAKCQRMVEVMKQDREPKLMKGSIPEGTLIAHKHGFGAADGVINMIADAGIIETPGGDFVLSIYLSNPELLLWDPSNQLIGRLALAVYNYYNFDSGK